MAQTFHHNIPLQPFYTSYLSHTWISAWQYAIWLCLTMSKPQCIISWIWKEFIWIEKPKKNWWCLFSLRCLFIFIIFVLMYSRLLVFLVFDRFVHRLILLFGEFLYQFLQYFFQFYLPLSCMKQLLLDNQFFHQLPIFYPMILRSSFSLLTTSLSTKQKLHTMPNSRTKISHMITLSLATASCCCCLDISLFS